MWETERYQGQNKETEKENASEDPVQERPFNYLACLQPKD